MNKVFRLYVDARAFGGCQAARSADRTRTVYNAMHISMSASGFIPVRGWVNDIQRVFALYGLVHECQDGSSGRRSWRRMECCIDTFSWA